MPNNNTEFTRDKIKTRLGYAGVIGGIGSSAYLGHGLYDYYKYYLDNQKDIVKLDRELGSMYRKDLADYRNEQATSHESIKDLYDPIIKDYKEQKIPKQNARTRADIKKLRYAIKHPIKTIGYYNVARAAAPLLLAGASGVMLSSRSKDKSEKTASISTNSTKIKYPHEVNHPNSNLTPQPVDVRMIAFEDEHPVTADTFLTDYDTIMEADEDDYLSSVDEKYPKTWKTRAATIGRYLAPVAGFAGGMYAGNKLRNHFNKVRGLHPKHEAIPLLAELGGTALGFYASNQLKTPRSRALDAIRDDIDSQQYNTMNKAFGDSRFIRDYTKEHLRSVRIPLGRSARMNALFDQYNLPSQYQRNVKLAAEGEPQAKYDNGMYFAPQPIRARIGVANAATKGESIAYNARNAGLAASTAGALAAGAYLAGLKNPAVNTAALGLMASGVGAIAGGNLYLKYSDNGRKAEAKLDTLKKNLQTHGGFTHFGPTRFGKMEDKEGNEYITRGFTATRQAPTGRLFATATPRSKASTPDTMN